MQSVQGLKEIFITRGEQMTLFMNVEPESRGIKKIACQSGILMKTLDSVSKALPE